MRYHLLAFAWLSLATPLFAQLPENSAERKEALASRAKLQTQLDKALAAFDRDEVIRLLKDAVELDKKIHGPGGETTLRTMGDLAHHFHGAADYVAEGKLIEELLPLAEKRYGDKHWRTMTIRRQSERSASHRKNGESKKLIWVSVGYYEKKALELRKKGDFEGEVEAWQGAARFAQIFFTKTSIPYAEVLQSKGLALAGLKKWTAAIDVFEELVALDLELYGEPHPDTTANQFFLGGYYRKSGQPSKAEPHLLKSLKAARTLVAEGGMPKEWILTVLRGLTSFYLDLSDVVKMRPLSIEAREYAAKEFGKLSPQFAAVLLDAILMDSDAMEYTNAEASLSEAAELIPKVFKTVDGEHARFYRGMAELRLAQGRYDESRTAINEAIKILVAQPKPDRVAIYDCCVSAGLIALHLQNGVEAAGIFEQVLPLAEVLSGEEAGRLSTCLHNLGSAHDLAGSTQLAEKNFLKSLALKVKLEKDSLFVTTTLVSLGSLYASRGDFATAEPYLQKAAEIRTAKLGEKHPLVANSYSHLGDLHMNRGDFRRAEFYYRKAFELYKAVAPEHPKTAGSLVSLAGLQSALGDQPKAIILQNEALAIQKKILPEDHPTIATSMLNLALFYSMSGADAKADTAYREAIQRMAKNKVFSQSDLAMAWQHLGHSLHRLKQPEDAATAYEQAMKAWAKYEAQQPKGKPHSAKTELLFDLSTIRLRENKADDALALSAEAVKIARDSASPDTLANALVVRGIVLQACGKTEDAFAALREAMDLHDQLLNNVMGFTSEAAMLQFAGRMQQSFHRVIQAATESRDPKMAEFALELVGRRKGIILDRLCRYRDWERQLAGNAALHAEVREFRGLKQRLADATLHPRPGDTPESLRKMQGTIDDLQAKISRRFSDAQPGIEGQFDSARLRAKLAPNSVLIEFIRTDNYEFTLGERAPRRMERYVAFVLPADPKSPLQLIDLGSAETIDEACAAVRKRLEAFPLDTEAKEERNYRRAASALYELLFKPLKASLAGAESLVVVPDGELYRIPFAALVDGENKYLVETLRIAILPSGRDLFRTEPKEKGEGVAIFANPDYDGEPAPWKITDESPRGLVSRGAAPEFRSGGWVKLPNTKEEARAIEATMKDAGLGAVKAFEGPAAREEEVKRLRSPRILHFATHGQYVEKSATPESADLRNGSRQAQASNPLLRSAVVLAGVNKLAAIDGTPRDDGLLTAEEVSLLNLRGTELVVLSACESGLGDVKTSEGVFGLHRAFIHAGARSLVVSLYSVPDRETFLLMKGFYEGLAAKKGPAAALHESQLKLIRDRRGEGNLRPAHPLFWAGFISVGIDR